MKLLFSAFTGFNLRELLLPLSPLLDQDNSINQVVVITPGYAHHEQLFPNLKQKYIFANQQEDYADILSQHQPDIVITPTAGLEPRDIPLIKAAQQASIPTLTFIASWDNVYKMARFIKLKKYKQGYALADHFAVWNEMNRDHLLRIAPRLKPGQVVITGPPRLDFLADQATIPSRADLLAALGITDQAKHLIHIATTELYPSDYIIQALASLNANLFVSVHPGGQLETHRRYAAPYGAYTKYSFGRRNNALAPDFLYSPTLNDIRMHAALFKHADLLVNHSSTVTIESLLANTPVINVKYGRSLDWWRWHRSMIYRDFKQHARIIVESGATQVVSNPRQLIKAASHYLANPTQDQTKREALARQMVAVTDGTAGRTLLNFIKHVASL